jgi:hypothetical protein
MTRHHATTPPLIKHSIHCLKDHRERNINRTSYIVHRTSYIVHCEHSPHFLYGDTFALWWTLSCGIFSANSEPPKLQPLRAANFFYRLTTSPLQNPTRNYISDPPQPRNNHQTFNRNSLTIAGCLPMHSKLHNLRPLNNNLSQIMPRKSVKVHPFFPKVYLMSFLRRQESMGVTTSCSTSG